MYSQTSLDLVDGPAPEGAASTDRELEEAPLPAWLWPAVIAASGILLGLSTVGESLSALRPALALWFLGVCPGMAYVPLLRLRHAVAELTLGIALSIALDMLVAEALIYVHAWSWTTALTVLLALSALGTVAQVLRPEGPSQGTEAPHAEPLA